MPHPLYTPEQLAMHQRIVDAALAGKQRAEHPEFVVLCGGVKSGKAFYYKKNFAVDDSVVCIRTRLFRDLPYFKQHPGMAHPEKLPAHVDEYYDICADICKAAHARGLSVHWLDHGDSPEQMTRMLQIMKGYDSQLLGFYLPPRMQSAVTMFSHLKGGKHIEAVRGRQIQQEFARSWASYEPQFNESSLFTASIRDAYSRVPETLVCQRGSDGVRHVHHSARLALFESLATAHAAQR